MTGGGGGLLAPPHSGSSGSVHITEEYGRTPVITGFAPRTRGRISPHTAHQTSSHVGIAGFLVEDSSSKSSQPPSGPPRRFSFQASLPARKRSEDSFCRPRGSKDSAARTPEIVRHPAPGPDRFFHPPMQIRRTRRRFPGSGSFQKPSEHGDSIPLRQIWRDSQDAGVASPSNRPVDEEPHPPQKTASLLRAN